MTPADTFPFASSASRSMQVDHTGTRRLPGAPRRPITVELWHTPFEIDIDADYHGAA